MASYLAQFRTIKSICNRLVVAVEDVSDLWPLVKDAFEERTPFKKAYLNNKTHSPINVENLPVEFILTTDARLRSRFPQEQSVWWFREPYATVVLVTCEDFDEFKTILKPRLKLIVQNDEKEWIIVFISKAHPSNDQASKLAKKIYAKLEVDFNAKKREGEGNRLFSLFAWNRRNFWEDLEAKIVESIRSTLDRRIQFYEEEIRKLSEQRFMPVWNFCNFFILKESLAFMFEMAHLHEDSLREYDELELCYLETVNTPTMKKREFGGSEKGDDQAALLNPDYKPLTQIVQDDSFREFEFRQYLFACQCKLLFKLGRPVEVATRGHSFIISFSKTLTLHEHVLPFCLKEVWIVSACLALIDSTTSKYDGGTVAADADKEFYRLIGDLYSLSRVKVKLCFLGQSPHLGPQSQGTSSELPTKEKRILQAIPDVKFLGIQRKPLPLEPSSLLREANRRRASRSAGNVSELLEGCLIQSDGSGFDGLSRSSPSGKINMGAMPRAYSSPVNYESSLPLDHPMMLLDIHVATKDALHQTISDLDLWKSLSSVEEFEAKYFELTKGAADNYHRSWWKRHGVVLDGEIAAISFRRGNIDLAAKSYEKVCALYSGEGWHDLLAEVLPNLAECQKILNHQAGYLSSCIRLLSLDGSLFLNKERQAFQTEVLRLAHSSMKEPLPLDVSSLITFSGNPGPPLQLCDGDPGILSVALWSGFPDDITLESLSLTLIPTFNADEAIKAIKCSSCTALKPGKNIITLELPPQKPGSYVLGVLTGQIGNLLFRSHSFSKVGPPDSDDFMNYEKPTRPVLKVFKPRQLVDISAAISSALLMNEPQWVGLVIRPLDYPLRGAILHIDTGPELVVEDSQMIEIESYEKAREGALHVETEDPNGNGTDGRIAIPDWASNLTSIIWLPVHAVSNELARGTSAVYPQRHSVVDGMRTIALKLDFGVALNQTFERTIAVHFTDPFRICTRVADKCNDDGLLLQVVIHSQVKACLKIDDAWLELEAGILLVGKGDGRPISTSFPLVLAPSSRAGCESEALQVDGILNIRYRISGNRSLGAHAPVPGPSSEGSERELLFRSALALQRPVLDPSLAIGFFSFPSDCVRVGQLICMKWRVARLKDLEDPSVSGPDGVLYEVDANPENWMIAGRKRGHVALSTTQVRFRSTTVITVNCMPLASGHVHPPQLALPGVQAANISYDPPGPHLVRVLPPRSAPRTASRLRRCTLVIAAFVLISFYFPISSGQQLDCGRFDCRASIWCMPSSFCAPACPFLFFFAATRSNGVRCSKRLEARRTPRRRRLLAGMVSASLEKAVLWAGPSIQPVLA
ncbi:unnamed protein product [Spirodela intermedia]|uniref:Uncharacterized protein n=1 Tax=Spirodela intermedia TaxID=51605 RepID=A0A7I8IKM2_SPIIN|nr:unnamed protein product [Spirodela intermedia]CAA6658433.1 unnamed protein product [Spirodela intermedia]